MAKASKSVQEKNVEELQAVLKPGDTVFTLLRHVSRSGMYRAIDLYVFRDNEPRRITWQAAQLLEGYDKRHEAAKASGCGMDMGFHLVYNLSTALHRNGFPCIGKGCPANDHCNARDPHCPVCGADNPNGSAHKRGCDRVCSKACMVAPWQHRDGGYALNHRWL